MNVQNSATFVMERDQKIQAQLDRKAQQKDILSRILPFVGFIFVFLFFLVVTQGKLLNEANRVNLINQSFTLTLICIGASFVYAYGGSDFSVGASCGCAQLIAAILLTEAGAPLWVSIAVCIMVAIAASCMTAGISLVLGVPVFVGSMCIRTAFSGILLTATQKKEYFIPIAEYGFMNNTAIKAVILVIFCAVGFYLFRYTGLGKSLCAIGGNIKTAQQAGIRIKKQVLIAHIILGLCVGVAATFQMFRNAAVNSTSGNGIEFNLMMAIVLGGFPLRGGERAKLSAAVIGALTVTVLINGLALWGVDAYAVNLIKGVLFVSIVALSYDRSMGKLVN